MSNFLKNFDQLSFWLGFVAATIFWGIIRSLRPVFENILENIKKQREEAKARAAGGVEANHRRIIYRHAQEMHLASSLFALDEIVQAPRFLAPPPQIEPGIQIVHENVVDQAIPYMPDWPEVAAYYHAESIGLPELLSGNANLMIVGNPGTGKSTTLAYLAAQMANRAPEFADLEERVPFIIHVANLGLPRPETKKPEELLQPIIADELTHTPLLAQSSITTFIPQVFEEGDAMLLLDGIDELPPPQIQEVTAYLRQLVKAYPKTRLVITSSLEYANGLLSLNFVPVTILPWTKSQQTELLDRWDMLWKKYITKEAWAQMPNPVDTLLLKRWLSQDNATLSPLEYTLKIWGGYAGDIRGPKPVDLIESHLRRIIPADIPVTAAETLSLQANLKASPIFESNAALEWVKAFETNQAASATTTQAGGSTPTSEAETADPAIADAKTNDKTKKDNKKKPSIQNQPIPVRLAASGLLQNHPNAKMRFTHMVFGSYLAARGISTPDDTTAIASQTNWVGRNLSIQYMAAYYDISPIIENLLNEVDHMLYRPVLVAARLLREAPSNLPWRGIVLKTLIEMIQNAEIPVALRGQAMAACVLSGETGMGALFRQLAMDEAPEVRQLAALGLGILKDNKAVDSLAAIIEETYGRPQMAALLALVAIGSQAALEAVAVALLRGDEDMRRNAAEALANHPTEGYEALRDGIQSEDILIRRACVYGLARINESWANDILTGIQTQDSQWVVRNAAVELLDERNKPSPRIPRPLGPPSETPWVLELAGRYGMGVAPGQPATDIFLLAIKGDRYEERSAALRYLRATPSEGVISALYSQMYGTDQDLKEEIYQNLRLYGFSGVQMPPPKQFGLG